MTDPQHNTIVAYHAEDTQGVDEQGNIIEIKKGDEAIIEAISESDELVTKEGLHDVIFVLKATLESRALESVTQDEIAAIESHKTALENLEKYFDEVIFAEPKDATLQS